MSAEDVHKRFTAPLLQPVLDMAELWFTQFYPFITFHDPLAAATIFDASLCTYRRGRVILQNEEAGTKMIWQPRETDAPHQVAMTVDIDRYFQHFFSVIGE
jgi:inosine-uridine nucleoside N-ribohydrolase